MVTKNGDMTISSWRRQLQASFESFDLTLEVTGNGGVILQEETMVLHGRWTYFEANSRDGGKESFQEEACDNDDDDDDDDDNDDDGNDSGVAGEENKWINKQINKLETRLEPGKNS